jgi:hypothetical protein
MASKIKIAMKEVEKILSKLYAMSRWFEYPSICWKVGGVQVFEAD